MKIILDNSSNSAKWFKVKNNSKENELLFLLNKIFSFNTGTIRTSIM